MMAETMSETEESGTLTAIAELVKHKQLSPATLRQVLSSGEQSAGLIGEMSESQNKAQPQAQAQIEEEQSKEAPQHEVQTEPLVQPITGQFVALDAENAEFAQLVQE